MSWADIVPVRLSRSLGSMNHCCNLFAPSTSPMPDTSSSRCRRRRRRVHWWQLSGWSFPYIWLSCISYSWILSVELNWHSGDPISAKTLLVTEIETLGKVALCLSFGYCLVERITNPQHFQQYIYIRLLTCPHRYHKSFFGVYARGAHSFIFIRNSASVLTTTVWIVPRIPFFSRTDAYSWAAYSSCLLSLAESSWLRAPNPFSMHLLHIVSIYIHGLLPSCGEQRFLTVFEVFAQIFNIVIPP